MRTIFQNSVRVALTVAGIFLANVAQGQQPAMTWMEDQVDAHNVLLQAPANSIDGGYVYAFEGYMGFVNGTYQFIYTGNLYFATQCFPVSQASNVGRYWMPYHLHKVIVRRPVKLYFTPSANIVGRARLSSGAYSATRTFYAGTRYIYNFGGASTYALELTDSNGRMTMLEYNPN